MELVVPFYFEVFSFRTDKLKITYLYYKANLSTLSYVL